MTPSARGGAWGGDDDQLARSLYEIVLTEALVRGYEPKSFYLFSKHALSSGAVEKVEGMPEWHLVTVEDMYR